MGKKDSELLDTLTQALSVQDLLLPGEASQVDKEKCICVVKSGGRQYNNVLLRSILSDDEGVVLFPEENSEVLCVKLPRSNRLFVIKCEKIESAQMKIGESLVFVNAESFSVKNADTEVSGDSGGLVVKTQSESLKGLIDELLDGIMQMTVTTGVGPSGPPINLPVFTGLKTRLNNLLKA